MMPPIAKNDRTTKYVSAVRVVMDTLGHATNVQIRDMLRQEFPDVSDTTIHRVTARMIERGELQYAPGGVSNVMRFDANVLPHDHFMCEGCGMLRDAEFGDAIRGPIEQTIGDGCSISGSLTVSGICKRCRQKEEV